MKTSQSESLMDRAQKVMPGGVNSPVRSFKYVGGKPFVVAKGEGPYLYDVDRNKYIDLVGSWGPLIHGHNHPRIRSAVEEILKRGASFGATCEIEIQLAEKIVEIIPWVQKIRLVNSGTEACMSAIRLARGATGREIILKFDGHYHGHGDSFLVSAGSGVATLSVSGSAGIPEKTLQSTVVAPFNDFGAVKAIFDSMGARIAGVILEPVPGNMGLVLPDPTFLKNLREICTQNKSVLIFDEVMSGFRVALAGAASLYGIEPDLVCLGKIIGGGFPVGAYGGKRELMDQIAPLGSVYQAGTLSGNPIGCAAGYESLLMICERGAGFYQALDRMGSEWKSTLEAHIQIKGYEACVTQIGSMLSIYFCREEPRNFREAKKTSEIRFQRFFWTLLERGVYFPPSPFESCFLSAAHDESIMERVIETSLVALDVAHQKG